MLQILFGILLLALGVYLAMKVIGNALKVLFILALFGLGMFLILGYVPFVDKIDLKSLFGLSIDGVGKDKDGC
jgi:hypothetical protein